MASKTINNHYINAPAGSGKTYYIKNKINTILSKNPTSRILCITYTNRAANEMEKRIVSEHVEISTIHSFIQSFLNPFLSLDTIIRFYTEEYWPQISKSYEKNPDKYNGKHGLEIDELSKEIFIENTKTIYYGETNYSRWLEGGLSHDELLEFAFLLISKYNVIKLKLKELYDHIFIDEVQDTTTSILNFFYSVVKDSNTSIYYLGDKMQEVFDKYDGGFEEEFNEMNTSETKKFTKNYRSRYDIVTVLENIYKSNKKPIQEAKRSSNDIKPKIILCSSINEFFQKNSHEYEAFLRLRTNNRMIFKNENNDLEELFNSYNKIYTYNSEYSVPEILLPKEEVSNDNIISFVYLMYDIVNYFLAHEYGKVIQKIKTSTFNFNGRREKIYNQTKLSIKFHKDKEAYREQLSKIANYFNEDNIDDTLSDLINYLHEEEIISEKYYKYLIDHCDENEQVTYEENVPYYKEVFSYPISKFVYLCNMNGNQKASTQHGVKGEGHEKVMFVAEDNIYTPRIDMKIFLKLFSKMDELDFDELQDLYYNYSDKLNNLLLKLGISKYNEIKKEHRDNNSKIFKSFFEDFENNKYLNLIKDINFEFDQNLTIKDIKNLVRITELKGTLQAYKLFYVGCSRAMDELVILIEKDMILDFELEFKEKFESIGFEIVE